MKYLKNVALMAASFVLCGAVCAAAAERAQSTYPTFPQEGSSYPTYPVGTYPSAEETYPSDTYPTYPQDTYPPDKGTYPSAQDTYPQTADTYPQDQGTYPTYPSGTYPVSQETYPSSADTYPTEMADKKPAKKRERNLNEREYKTGQKVVFADGRESAVYVREDLLRKDLKKMPVLLENGSTVYMTPKQASRYLKRKEEKQRKREKKQSRQEQKLENAVKAQIKQKQEKS